MEILLYQIARLQGIVRTAEMITRFLPCIHIATSIVDDTTHPLYTSLLLPTIWQNVLQHPVLHYQDEEQFLAPSHQNLAVLSFLLGAALFFFTFVVTVHLSMLHM